jgi:hypothetical protein
VYERALEKVDLELGAEFGDLRLIMAWLDFILSAYNTRMYVICRNREAADSDGRRRSIKIALI